MAKSPAELLQARPAADAGATSPTAPKGWCSPIWRARSRRAPMRRRLALLVICRDGPRMAALARALAFFAPDIDVLEFPAWDCLPYDRVSPHAGVVAQRMTALSRLARVKGRDRPSVLLTTVNAALQRVPARELVADAGAVGRARQRARHGRRHRAGSSSTASSRASTVREPGDYAVRGGILDLFAPGMDDAGAARFLRRHAGDDPQLRSGDAAHARRSCARSIWCRSPNSSSPPRPSAASAPAMSRRSAPPTPRRSALRGGERGPPLSRHGALAAAVPRQARDAVRLSARHAGGARARWPRTPRTSGSPRSPTITRRAARR